MNCFGPLDSPKLMAAIHLRVPQNTSNIFPVALGMVELELFMGMQ
jgi:hypothetical protein